MTFASWLKHLPWVATRKTKPIRKSGQRRPSFKPHVEQLETRLAPAILTVTSDADTGAGTLRNQLAAASSGDTIQFASTLTGGTGNTIDLASVLSITKNVTIDGTGSPITVSGQNSVQVVNVSSAITVGIKNLTISNGKSASGGGIYFNGTSLTLTNDTFSGNTATKKAGAIYINAGTVSISSAASFSTNSAKTGGAIYLNTGTLQVVDSTFSSNTASSSGGVIFADAGTFTASGSTFSGNHATARSGGAIYNYHATTTLTNDTLSGNNSGTFGGAVYNHGTLTLTDDTLSGNTSKHQGGGLANLDGNATVTDVTFNGNSAATGGAIYQRTNGSVFHMVSDTIAGNSANSTGGGIYMTAGNLTSFNSILDGNTAAKGPDVYLSGGTFASSGGNLYGSTSGVTWKTTSTAGALYPDVHDAADNPELNSLASNGGYTQTMAPLSGSPALGAGNPVTNTLTTDQRGFTRVVNGKIDIGAYENQNQFFTLTSPGSNPSATAGTSTNFNLGSFSEIVGSSWTGSVSWGDGTTSTPTISSQGSLGSKSHTYYAPGSYTATVTLTDNYGNFSSMTFGVTVSGGIVVNTANDTSWDSSLYPYAPFDSSGNVSLRSAIQYANSVNYAGSITFASSLSGQTITLVKALGTLKITDTAGLTIDGGSDNITVSGGSNVFPTQGNIQVVNVSAGVTASIADLTITKGYSSAGVGLAGGGGIYNAGTLTLTDDTISDNYANFTGGGVYNAGSLAVTDGSITDNFASNGFGGGIYNASGATLRLTDVIVSSNGAEVVSGGGIYNASNIGLTLTGDTFSSNSAGKQGGGIYNAGGNMDVIGGSFTNNTTIKNGGAIYNFASGGLTLTGVTISGNTTDFTQGVGGGAIYNNGAGTLTLTDDTFSGNQAYHDGGAIHNGSGILTLSGNTFSGNIAGANGGGGDGGAIFSNTGIITSTDDTFTSNQANGESGGGIDDTGGKLTLSGDTFTGNQASTGGAIYIGGTATVLNCIFSSNSASEAGGAIEAQASLTLTDSTVASNQTGSGAGIYVASHTTTLSGDTIADNTANQSGGGIYVVNATVSVSDCTIAGNSAKGTSPGGGGGIYNSGGKVYLSNDTVAGNSAVTTGGGVYSHKSDAVSSQVYVFDTILDGNTAATGADAYSTAGSTFTSSGGNLYGSTNVTTWKANPIDVHDAADNPGLGGLQNNGGSTDTMAVLPGSLAYQAGQLTGGPTLPSTDQRGFARTVTISGNTYIDIGAFENQSQLFTVNPASSEPNTVVGQSMLFNLGSFGYSGNAGNVWTVTVNWGDGSPNSVFTTTSQGSLGTLNHTYTSLGNNKTFTVFVADTNGDLGQGTSPTFNVQPATSISPTAIAIVTTTLDLSAANPSVSPLTTAGNVSLRSAHGPRA